MTTPNKPPQPPEKPEPDECCGSGCVPCIYDYYFDRLAEWERRYEMTLTEFEALD